MIRSERDISFDNLKGLLIFLVVFCHFFEFLVPQWTHYPIVYNLYYCIYTFHMPAFIFCSGYFSKNSARASNTDRRVVSDCLIPYLVFQIFYCFLFFSPKPYITDSLLSLFNLTQPQWALWYLLCMFFWRILLRPAETLRWPLLTGILLALYIGTTSAGVFLSLSRTLTLFPFFLAGYRMTPDQLASVRRKSPLLALAVFALSLGISLWLASSGVPLGHIRMAQPYADFQVPAWRALLLRVLAIILGSASIFSLLALVGKRRSLFSTFGRFTLPIYVIHTGIIRLVSKFFQLRTQNAAMILLAAAISAFALCAGLGQGRLDKALRTMFRVISDLVLKTDSTSAEKP